MIRCYKCNDAINYGEWIEHNSVVLYEDCYLDTIISPVRKMHYEHDKAEFMQRLKASYPVRKQKFH